MTVWPILALVGLAGVGAWMLLQLVEAVDLLSDLERDEESRWPPNKGGGGPSSGDHRDADSHIAHDKRTPTS